jgi:hypothetical protein
MEPIKLDPQDRELEQSLAKLRPSPGGIEVEELCFRAGFAAGRKGINVWRGVTAAVVILCGGMFVVRPSPGPVVVDRVASVQHEIARPEIGTAVQDQYLTAANDGAYLRLRSEVLEKGVNALPVSVRGAGASQSVPRVGELNSTMLPDGDWLRKAGQL